MVHSRARTYTLVDQKVVLPTGILGRGRYWALEAREIDINILPGSPVDRSPPLAPGPQYPYRTAHHLYWSPVDTHSITLCSYPNSGMSPTPLLGYRLSSFHMGITPSYSGTLWAIYRAGSIKGAASNVWP
jgi:hypothetical protein